MSPKRLLLICPSDPGVDFTSKFSYAAAALIDTEAQNLGWQVTKLSDGPLATDVANRNNVETCITNTNPDLIIHYGHGDPYSLKGQLKQAVLECEGATPNVSKLTWALVSTVSCFSALHFGNHALQYSARSSKAFLGYAMPMGVHYGYVDYFTRAANAANSALLRGKTFKEAIKAGVDQYSDEINKLQALKNSYVNHFVVPIMEWDRAFLTKVGDNGAVP